MSDLDMLAFLINRLAIAQLVNPLEMNAAQGAIDRIKEKLEKIKEEEQ